MAYKQRKTSGYTTSQISYLRDQSEMLSHNPIIMALGDGVQELKQGSNVRGPIFREGGERLQLEGMALRLALYTFENKGILLETGGRIYGLTEDKYDGKKLSAHVLECCDPLVLKAFVKIFDQAVERISGVVADKEFGRYNSIKFVDSIRGSPGGWMAYGEGHVEVTTKALRIFLDGFRRADYTAPTRLIRLGVTHELVHRFRHESQAEFPSRDPETEPLITVFVRGPETVPLLASFLDCPEYNAKIVKFAPEESFEVAMFERLRTGEGLKSHIRYDEDWAKASRILVWEYKQLHPEFTIPETLAEQKKLVLRLPSLYENVPQEKKDEILGKYIKAPVWKIFMLASDYKYKLGLLF